MIMYCVSGLNLELEAAALIYTIIASFTHWKERAAGNKTEVCFGNYSRRSLEPQSAIISDVRCGLCQV